MGMSFAAVAINGEQYQSRAVWYGVGGGIAHISSAEVVQRTV